MLCNPEFNGFCFSLQYLPKEELYAPPMNIRVHDNRTFGRKPVVGLHVVKSLSDFRCDPIKVAEEPTELPGESMVAQNFYSQNFIKRE